MIDHRMSRKVHSMTFQGRKLCVIIPTYNEAENIAELLERCSYSLAGLDFELVIVDDNSPDGTADLAESIGKSYGNVRVIRRPSKAGLATAILEGINATNADVIAVIDADLQHPPELLPFMYSLILNGYVLVIASRYVKGSRIEDRSISREFISRLATLISHMIFPKTCKVKDILSGYFMMKRELINNIKVIPSSFKILLAILVNMDDYSRVVEIPYTFHKRKRGVSKLNSREILNFVMDVVRMKFTTQRRLSEKFSYDSE